MQCRRRADYYVRESESLRFHAQDRIHLDCDRYGKARRETLDRSPRLMRSLSPHSIADSRREVGPGQRVDTIERRGEDWRLRTGRNNDIGSSSCSYGHVREGSNFEKVFLHNDHRHLSELHQKRGLPKPTIFSAEDEVLDHSHDLRYRHVDLKIRNEREINEGRRSDGSGQRMTDQKLLARGEGRVAMGPYNSHLDMGPASVDRNFLSSSRSLDVRIFNDERLKFRDHIVSDKSQGTDFHEVEESLRFNSRNIGYSTSSRFYSKEYESSSSWPLMSKHLESYQDGQYFRISDEFSARSHRDLMDPKEFNSYRRWTLEDSAIDLVSGKRNLTPHQQDANSFRGEHDNYFFSKPKDSYVDPSRVMQKSTQTHDYIDYDGAIMSGYEDFSRSNVANTSLLKSPNPENHTAGIAFDHYSLRKQTVLDYPDIELTTKVMDHGSEYAGNGSIHVEVGRRDTRDNEMSHINHSQYCQTLHGRLDYGSEREVVSHHLKGRLPESSMSKRVGETYRNTERVQRMAESVGTYNLRDRIPKRKYIEEDMNLLDHSIGMSSEYTPSEVVDLYNSGEEWMDDENNPRYTSKKAEFDHKKFRKSNKKYDRHNLYASDDSFSRERYLDHAQEYKSGPKYMKGNRRHGPSNRIKSQNVNVDHRNGLHRPHKVWKNTGENDCANDDDLSDELVIPTESEPPEDSEKFKQMVHEAYLKCSKKLNMKPSAIKKYKEQGNAGSLYCIVCGKSYSKEFLDTQGLVKHAYMSHKVGCRAQHLGLAKALCVLMGWNSTLSLDTLTWFPEALPNEEAVVHQEDLIIWPPVIVIRNISMSYSDPKKWRVVTIEGLETFLRSKNQLKGRVKMSLGCPADQSVMVLKFLPTFSGLTDAERVNKFFCEKGHGRVNFEMSKGNNGKVEMEEDKIEEEVLYGYLGIAEDLHEVEFNVRKWSMIKSKKEILDL